MTRAGEWQDAVGRSWAREWRRTDRSFAPLTAQLVAKVIALSPQRIVDIGCGAGELSLEIAARLAHVQIRGIDLSNDLIAVAQARGAGCENAAFEVADAGLWSDADFVPDTLMSRHGVMFFDMPVAAFQSLARAAAPGARLAFSCFRERGRNAWITEIAALLPEAPTADPRAPGPFAFSEPDYVMNVLGAAGWADIHFEPVDWRYVAGVGVDPVADAVDFFSQIGPLAPYLRSLDAAAQAEFKVKVAALAEQNLVDGNVGFDAAAWIVTAHKEG